MVINLPQPDDSNEPVKSSCGSGGGCSSGEPCGSGLEKVYPTVAVRYGYMRTVGEFKYASPDMKFGCGANVIIQTRRGIEFGEMVSLTCDGCDKSVSRDQIKRYVAASGSDYYHFSNGKILRLATPDDEAEWEHLRAETLKKKAFCQQRADEHNLDMKVLECEHLFGGERTIFYFMSEERVDFRDLVRGLASEFRTRIEMRQVGARDEARLLADYETCGRECCCKNFLKSLKPVSMKMAKMQKATLDPAKVSGRCGRLKCCLRYEHTTYEELDKTLPGMGKRVQTPQGPGKVIGRQILTQLVLLATDDGGRLTVPVEETWAIGQPPPAALAKQQSSGGAQARQPQEQRDSERQGGRGGDRRPSRQDPRGDRSPTNEPSGGPTQSEVETSEAEQTLTPGAEVDPTSVRSTDAVGRPSQAETTAPASSDSASSDSASSDSASSDSASSDSAGPQKSGDASPEKENRGKRKGRRRGRSRNRGGRGRERGGDSPSSGRPSSGSPSSGRPSSEKPSGGDGPRGGE